MGRHGHELVSSIPVEPLFIYFPLAAGVFIRCRRPIHCHRIDHGDTATFHFDFVIKFNGRTAYRCVTAWLSSSPS